MEAGILKVTVLNQCIYLRYNVMLNILRHLMQENGMSFQLFGFLKFILIKYFIAL